MKLEYEQQIRSLYERVFCLPNETQLSWNVRYATFLNDLTIDLTKIHRHFYEQMSIGYTLEQCFREHYDLISNCKTVEEISY